MLSNRTETIGAAGEEFASYLIQKNGGYIHTKNFRSQRLEIDLIYTKPRCLIALEVKSSTGTYEQGFRFPKPEQIERLKLALGRYYEKNLDLRWKLQNPKMGVESLSVIFKRVGFLRLRKAIYASQAEIFNAP